MKTLAFLAILSIMGPSFPDILRLDCQTFADFSIFLENLADVGSILKSIIAKGLRECVLECTSLSNCTAVNYKKLGGTCELVGRELNKNLVEKTGWVYLTTDKQNRKVCR